MSGIVFVLLFVVGFALIGESGDNAAEVLAFYSENEARLIVAFFLLAASGLAYLWFGATLRGVLAREEREPRFLTGLGIAGGLATAILLIVGATPIAALTDGVDQFEGGGGGGAYALNSMAYPLLTVGIAASSLLALALGPWRFAAAACLDGWAGSALWLRRSFSWRRSLFRSSSSWPGSLSSASRC